MNINKIKLCREHWQALAPHVKERATAKHLLAAVEEAERGWQELDKLESAIELVLNDSESKPGGWGPDITMLEVLRNALKNGRSEP